MEKVKVYQGVHLELMYLILKKYQLNRDHQGMVDEGLGEWK